MCGCLGTCVSAVGNNDGRGPNDRAADAPPSRFGQKNNNQLGAGAAKVGSGRKESADNHMPTTMGNNRSMHLMTEQGGGR